MKLRPYDDQSKRWHKVCKHVFDTRERWWEILDGIEAWHRAWTVLRAAGCFGQPDGHLNCSKDAKTLETVSDHHDAWLAAAERAVDDAKEMGLVFPNQHPERAVYVGNAGVLVVLARGKHFVTCFRPGGFGSGVPPARATQLGIDYAERRTPPGWARRAGVRRASRRASLHTGSQQAAPRDEEPDHET